jgi:hypothetical protein
LSRPVSETEDDCVVKRQEKKMNLYLNSNVHGVGRAGAPETGADAPAAKVAVTGSVAFVGIPKVMLSIGGIPVPVAAGTTVTPVPVF